MNKGNLIQENCGQCFALSDPFWGSGDIVLNLKSIMKQIFAKAVAGSLLAASVIGTQAGTVVLDFEGVGNEAPVGSFYDGVGGPDYDITFSANALGLIDADAGGTGNIAFEPTPDTALFFLSGGAATMNVPAGFDTGFSFFYSAPFFTGSIQVYDDLNATGNLLATLSLPLTTIGSGDPNGPYGPFDPIGVSFPGIAKSVNFAGSANFIVFDNITLGAEIPVIENPNPVPEPSTVIGGLALGALALRRIVRRK